MAASGGHCRITNKRLQSQMGQFTDDIQQQFGQIPEKKSGQGTDESYTVTWKFFTAMMFLEATKVGQSTQSTSSMPLVT